MIKTREDYLTAAAAIICDELFTPHLSMPAPRYRVSLTAPKTIGAGTVLGECWSKAASADGYAEIFITAQLGATDTLEVLSVLTHELAHAYDNNASGHSGRFIEMCKAVGLAGGPTAKAAASFTATVPTTQLTEYFTDLIRNAETGLGEFPHGALTPSLSGKKPQKNRQLKVACDSCDFKFRASQKTIDSIQHFDCLACPTGTLSAED
jgi:hypothetical protein